MVFICCALRLFAFLFCFDSELFFLVFECLNRQKSKWIIKKCVIVAIIPRMMCSLNKFIACKRFLSVSPKCSRVTNKHFMDKFFSPLSTFFWAFSVRPDWFVHWTHLMSINPYSSQSISKFFDIHLLIEPFWILEMETHPS